jgi:Flp pilus assembly protein TadD
VAIYKQAVALDPGYAAAYAGLSWAEAYAADYAESAVEVDAGQQRAVAAADKAIALEAELADGYTARGTVRFGNLWDWAGAQADFEKALALEPGSSTVQRRYGVLLEYLGRVPEAIAAFRKAIELDPLSAGAWSNLGLAYCANGELPEAREALSRALTISPEAGLANFNLGTLELLEGQAQAALTAFRHAGAALSQTGMAMAEHTLGHAKESQQALDELIAKYGHDGAAQIAMVYAWRNEPDKAFEWFDRAYAQHDGGLSAIKIHPIYKSLRSDPRFAAMVKKLGMPP